MRRIHCRRTIRGHIIYHRAYTPICTNAEDFHDRWGRYDFVVNRTDILQSFRFLIVFFRKSPHMHQCRGFPGIRRDFILRQPEVLFAYGLHRRKPQARAPFLPFLAGKVDAVFFAPYTVEAIGHHYRQRIAVDTGADAYEPVPKLHAAAGFQGVLKQIAQDDAYIHGRDAARVPGHFERRSSATQRSQCKR